MEKLVSATPLLVAVLGLHALFKFAFFALPYRTRRAALDKSYGPNPTATRVSDVVLLSIVIALTALLFYRGVEPTSFLGGLWIGATLIQLYFHRFLAPLAPDRAPPPVVSPIKTMSYAIQDSPWRPWREIVSLFAIIIGALILILRAH